MPTHTDNQPIVLIADDNVWMQRILAKILLSYGIQPAFASDGYEAVSRAVDLQPIAIVLDIIMPDLSGHQTLRLLKSISLTSHIPVLVITVASDADNLGVAIKLGATGFIRKPFTRGTIYEKLAEVIGESTLRGIAESASTKVSDEELDQMMTRTQHGAGLVKYGAAKDQQEKAYTFAAPSNSLPEDVIKRFGTPQTMYGAGDKPIVKDTRRSTLATRPDADIVHEVLGRVTRK